MLKWRPIHLGPMEYRRRRQALNGAGEDDMIWRVRSAGYAFTD